MSICPEICLPATPRTWQGADLLMDEVKRIAEDHIFEAFFPILFYAGALADAMTNGLKLKGPVYTFRGTTRERTEKLLRKLSDKFYLRVSVNTTREEEAEENDKMTAAGWELVAPGGMSHTSRLRPYRFCIYGAPRTKGEAPELPDGVVCHNECFIAGEIRGELIMYPDVFPAAK